MAKLRTNHGGKGNSMGGGTIAKVGIFGAIIAGLMWFFNGYTSGSDEPVEDERIEYTGEEYSYPKGGTGQLIEHNGFALSYDEEWEQAEWTAHILKRSDLQQQWSKRNDDFRADPAVKTGSASDDDYRGSGYDRGHLVPRADLAWDAAKASESFFMSNISPQARQFNQGVWRELEELTRDWANKNKRLYVVTGPVMTMDPKGTIGRRNKIAVPAAYFKVLLDLDDPELKGIGFLLPNQVSFDPLYEYAMSIDQVEDATGLDFFADLMPAGLEQQIEADGNIDLWQFSKKKFDRRINDWNNVSN